MNIQVAFSCWLLEMMPQWTLMHIYVIELVLFVFQENTQKWSCWIITSVLFLTFEAPLHVSPQHLHQFTITPRGHEGSLFSTPLPVFSSVVFDDKHSDSGGWCLIVVLMCLTLMMNDGEHLFTFASLFIIERCCIKISCCDDGFISLLFLQAKCLQVYNNYNFCMNWPFNLGTHCSPNKYFLS